MESLLETILTLEEKKGLLKIKGMIVTENAHQFQQNLDEIKNSECRDLALDFSACRIICSTGISKLMMFCNEFAAMSGKVEIVSCSSGVYELFTTIKLDQIMPITQ